MADGIIWPERFLYDCCMFASRRDLFNLGDKLLFDLAAVFIFRLPMCKRDAFFLTVCLSLPGCFS